jgi:oxygen-independent coproporphyrinogen-3 oxidase
LKEDNQISSYISALYQEITAYSQKLKKSNIKTIYLGGGTPTILSGTQICNILEFCKEKYKIDKDNIFLKKLGRIHNTQEIIDSYYLAREAGFNNINIDIMFALPDQTTEDLQATLKKAVSLKPDHLSLYNLTIKPGTEYYKEYKRGKLKLSTEDEEFNMYNWAINFLEESGFEHYEIANFARPHKRSIHNMIYWQNKPYLGIGAGAYSFIRGYRYMNYENPARYIKEIMSGKLPIDNGEQ